MSSSLRRAILNALEPEAAVRPLFKPSVRTRSLLQQYHANETRLASDPELQRMHRALTRTARLESMPGLLLNAAAHATAYWYWPELVTLPIAILGAIASSLLLLWAARAI